MKQDLKYQTPANSWNGKELYYKWLTDPNSNEKFLVVMLERSPEEGTGVDLITLKLTKKEGNTKRNLLNELEYAEVVNDQPIEADNFVNRLLQQINSALA